MRVKNVVALKALVAQHGMDVDESGAVTMGRAVPAPRADMTEVLAAIRSMPKPQVVMPAVVPQSPKKWTFTVIRDEDGFMEKIIAEAN